MLVSSAAPSTMPTTPVAPVMGYAYAGENWWWYRRQSEEAPHAA